MDAQLGTFKLPAIVNEPTRSYAKGSADRARLDAALKAMRAAAPFRVPTVINGVEDFGASNAASSAAAAQQLVCCDHQTVLATVHQASLADVDRAIDGAMAAKHKWEAMPFVDRAAVFLAAADLLADKHRYEVIAASMLGQGKTAWQGEIDAAAEMIDFWRFNCLYAAQMYAMQPPENSPGVWNRVEYRGLDGFVYAMSPFNFTSIGMNLCSAPALVGNVVIWKPAPAAAYSNYLLYKILVEAGLPAGVIQFVPGPAVEITAHILRNPDFAGLHFTGSTAVFRSLWTTIGQNIARYRSYPRIVGETGGKNFHMVHPSADPASVVAQTVRAAFEYQGQKCSACSRLYVPASLWPAIKAGLVRETGSLKVGRVDDWESFVSAVVDKKAFDRIQGYISRARDSSECEVIAGGVCDASQGYYIHPTVIHTTNPKYASMVEEIFGPVLTVYVYPDAEYEQTLELVGATSEYALTGSIFARDRDAVRHASNKLRHAAGNFYVNDKCTGAVVGQQPFGGGKGSGTNDKAGSMMLLMRFVSARTIKENFIPVTQWSYPSNEV